MAAKFAVKSLDHLVLTVRSIPLSVAFYTAHLGMRHEVFTSPTNPGVERYYSLYNDCIRYARGITGNQTLNHGERHALLFGSQKINLHQVGKEFEPKAQNVMSGSADLCFLTDQNVEKVLEAFQEASIEVWNALYVVETSKVTSSILGPRRSESSRENRGNRQD